MIRTNLIDAYDLMMDFIEKHLNDPFYLEGDMRISLRDKIFREAVSNIISHRDYISASPSRLMIYKNEVIFDNPCTQHFFGEITPNNLEPYSHNPTICKFMIQLGRFDELGSGVRNINKYLPLYSKGAKPTFKETKQIFRLALPLINELEDEKTHQVTHQVTQQVEKLLLAIKGEMSRAELMDAVKINDRVSFRENYLKKALNDGLIERTEKELTSKNQKYRLTEKGKNFLEQK